MCLGDWNIEMVSKVIQDFPKLSCESRIFLAKCMNIIQDIKSDDHHKQIMALAALLDGVEEAVDEG